jgi:hypothetical protein
MQQQDFSIPLRSTRSEFIMLSADTPAFLLSQFGRPLRGWQVEKNTDADADDLKR